MVPFHKIHLRMAALFVITALSIAESGVAVAGVGSSAQRPLR
jgi:hypothetical protein